MHDVLEQLIHQQATCDDLLPALHNALDECETLGLTFPKDFRGNDSIKEKWIKDMTHFCQNFYPPRGEFKTEQLLIYRVSPTRAIQGYIDLMKLEPDGSVSVYDWKTSTRFAPSTLLEHGRQLVIYAMALEQAGYTVKNLAWIMLKYVEIRYTWYATSRSRNKTQCIRIVNRSKIYDTIAPAVESACRDAGMDEAEIEFAMLDFKEKLNFGDYSAKVILPTGVPYSLENIVVIERKMSSDEIANCFTSQRDRFTREFERAKAAGARTYLLVERTTWEMLYAGTYRSKMSPVAMVASLTTWLARYDCKLIFCEPQTSGKLIHDILYREMKQHLEGVQP